MRLLHVILISSVVAVVNSGRSRIGCDFEVCHTNDPKFIECITRSFTDALHKLADGCPALGMKRWEPFFVEAIDLNDASTGTVSLQQHYRNINLYGTTRATITDIIIDFDVGNSWWSFTAFHPELRLESDYHMTGKVLLLPINGHGKCRNLFTNVTEYHKATFDRYTKPNGKTHQRITSYEFDMRPTDVHFYFENIVDGNEELSKQITQTVNDNGLSIFNEVKNGFEQSFAQIYTELVNNVLSRVPEDELFPE